MPANTRSVRAAQANGAQQCRRKFLRYFPGGFYDAKYLAWERGYKWKAHEDWQAMLDRATHRALLKEHKTTEVAARAVRIESRTNLLFSFEKMALRDAVKSPHGARIFAEALYDWLYGSGSAEHKFECWIQALDKLPRKQTRVVTWPLVTVWGFVAQPDKHFFLKPNVTRIAANAYGYTLPYTPRPNWTTYAALLEFAAAVRRDLHDLRPRDMIDIQSFLWVQGSDEYSA